jgi:hypothetical protein
MPRYKYVVLSDPVAGREDEYNDWYDHQHLGDLLAIDGVESAQRFRLVSGPGDAPQTYLAIYDFDTDGPDAILAEVSKRIGTPAMPISEALDTSRVSTWLFEEMG